MISYELTEEQNIIRSIIGELAAKQVRPSARAMDNAGQLDDAVLASLWSTHIIQSQGLLEIERSPVTNAILLEELGAADASLALATAAAIGYSAAIRDQGSDEQRAELEALGDASAFRLGAIAMTEPRFGPEARRFTTEAKRNGDGFLLKGKKAMVPLAGRCDRFLVVADHEGRADAFIVDRHADGVTVEAHKGTLGLRAAALTDVSFDNVQVSGAMRLGGEEGADIQRIIDGSRVAISAILTGMSREVMTYTIPFVKERRVDGMPLAQRQSIAFNIAEMHMDTEATRWMTWKAAWQIAQGDSATRQAQLAFSFAGRRAMAIADNGLQAFGGHGYVKENPLEMWYRNARTLSVLEGIAGV